MFNGEICKEGYPIIKDFWIECADSVENMRKKNITSQKDFKEIKKVFHFNKYDKTTVGLDTGENKAIFISLNWISKITGLDLSEMHILEGSFIAPEYFDEGDNIYEGRDKEPEYCRKGGTLLKNLNLRLYGNVKEMRERFENSEPRYSTGNYNKNDYGESYDSDNWLMDAAGTDDPEVMRDVYWNLD